MILRIDRIQTEMPPPSDPDPAGAAKVQELMGGRFGEMSTLMNYTFQSFNFRNRQGARPFYDLIANIAAEEYGHIELVSVAINTMLTGATPLENGRPPSDCTRSPIWACAPAITPSWSTSCLRRPSRFWSSCAHRPATPGPGVRRMPRSGSAVPPRTSASWSPSGVR